jgi:hypothetical protein
MPILALAAICFADEVPAEKKKVVPAAPIVQKPAVAAEDAAAEYKELVDAYNKATQEFYAEYKKARAADPKAVYDRSKHPSNEYRAKFEALARKVAGTDNAVDAWVMFVRCGGDSKQVAVVLLRDHIKSPKLVNALSMFAYKPDGAATYEKIIAASPHHEVKGTAMFMLAQSKMPRCAAATAMPRRSSSSPARRTTPTSRSGEVARPSASARRGHSSRRATSSSERKRPTSRARTSRASPSSSATTAER